MEEFEESMGLEKELEQTEEKLDQYKSMGLNNDILKEAAQFLKSEIQVVEKISSYEEGAILSGLDAMLFRYFLKIENPELYDQLDKISFILSDAMRDLVLDEREKKK